MSLGPIISRLFTCSNVEKNKKKIKAKSACSSPISMLAITANIFAAATNRTNIYKKDMWYTPLISLFNNMSMAKTYF
jgi:hypothetical protein